MTILFIYLSKMTQSQDHIVLLDGAVGTELERRGYHTHLPLWSASAIREAPKLLQKIHLEYIEGGAQIITANTFRTSIYTYERAGLSVQQVKDDVRIAHEIARIAQKQGRSEIKIAASITSLEDCYRPDLTPDNPTLREYHGQQIDVLKKTGFDLILVETMHTIREAEIIAQMCESYELPYILSFIPGSHGKLLSGESLMVAINRIAHYKPEAILLNCRPADALNHQLSYLKCFNGQIGIYPNGSGMPDDIVGWRFESEHPEKQFLNQAKIWIESGIDILGGCCGTRPTDIQQVHKFLGRN